MRIFSCFITVRAARISNLGLSRAMKQQKRRESICELRGGERGEESWCLQQSTRLASLMDGEDASWYAGGRGATGKY